ncbi:hypothetical protein [Kushneria phosphatilytica]|uniref:Phage tail tape measure protein n=1 Tax=Kushneria phosphatilytica TaxID=657387 RepID=A0A1S1NYT8_9GAMM|nr:hypothetical protein [Kushneria phosphatilytica]OHV13015.1 hypothetical protein BH688_03155 [Kushneria phosphatilytica]QEL10886.1 phage tail tape measure protein [Kushneria phosphatilytica]
MASRSLGQLTLDLVARIGGFTGPLEKAERMTKAKMTNIASSVKTAATSITAAGAAATGAAAAVVAYTNHAAQNARELKNQASVANTSVEQFQRMAYAANNVGVEQDKLSDILKDVNDRVGDFLTTGGGEMADFFQNIAPRIGMTADEFRNLSGPEALQKFYNGLQEANLSQAEMVFYMESISDNATALIPLLRDGGAGFAQMAQEADDLGIVLSDLDIAQLEEFSEQFNRLTSIMGSMSDLLAANLAPYLSVLGDYLVDATKGADGLREALPGALHDAVAALGPLLDNFQKFRQFDAQFKVVMASMDLAVAEFAEDAWDSMSYFIDTAINGINNLIRAVNTIPGVDDIDLIESFQDSDFFKGFHERTEDARKELEDFQQDLVNISSQEMPSAAIDRYLADVQQKIDSADIKPLSDWLFPPNRAGGSGGAGSGIDTSGIKKQIDSLQLEAKTVGMSSDEQKLYKLALDGATDSQIAQAKAALDTVSAFEKQKEASEDYQQLLEDLRSSEEKLTDQVNQRLAVLDAANVSADKYAEVAGKIAGAAFQDAPDYGGLDASVGGPTSELDKIDDAQEQLEEWYSNQLDMLSNFREERADLTAEWDEQEQQLKQEHEDKLADIERARQTARLAAGEEFFGNMSDITRTFFGEQSKEYRAMFAVEKAYALAKVAMNAPQTASDAYAAMAGIPFVGPALGIAAAAAALTYQTAQISAVESTSMSGMAHDGINSVPETGTWLLKKGERVTTADTSAKLDRTLDQVQRDRAPSGGGANVNIFENPKRGGESNSRTNEDGSTDVDVFVADIMGDGPRSKAISRKWKLQSRGT